MKKQAVIFIKCFIYSALIITLSSLLYFDEKNVETLKLKYRLKRGTPKQKEEVLNIFMDRHSLELVPSVVGAILDNTVSPRHGDTGWARIHHQAATAMCEFARSFDGKTQKEKGRHEYSFFNDGGVGTLERRIEVHRNWKQWWDRHKSLITSRRVLWHLRFWILLDWAATWVRPCGNQAAKDLIFNINN